MSQRSGVIIDVKANVENRFLGVTVSLQNSDVRRVSASPPSDRRPRVSSRGLDPRQLCLANSPIA